MALVIKTCAGWTLAIAVSVLISRVQRPDTQHYFKKANFCQGGIVAKSLGTGFR